MLQDLRENYDLAKLERADLAESPFQQFEKWFNYALEKKVKEPNAMTLATVNAEGQPSGRIVLLKEFNENGFIFYTNYDSRKGRDMQSNAKVALVFCWLSLHKQIRIEGKVEKISTDKSTKYFQSRPKGSQIGATASPQSEVIETRDILETNAKNLEEYYAEAENLPKPKNWGGYLVRPTTIEFWQGRPSRLHDRLRYSLEKNGEWKIERLAP